MICHFILYVSDQARSAKFYEQVLGTRPTLNVPGMTEFKLGEGCLLGLMPEAGIKRILGEAIQDPEKTNGAARAEVYFKVPQPQEFMSRAANAGARILSPLEERNWGDRAGYVQDFDGHVIAFACPI